MKTVTLQEIEVLRGVVEKWSHATIAIGTRRLLRILDLAERGLKAKEDPTERSGTEK
jgi:hypothetical protein